jgi:hypothetical protein
MENNNLELWDKVWKTTSDTKTKEVSYGKRKFTAIDAYSQIKTATKQFGKYWEKWGFEKIDYQVIGERLYFTWNFKYPNGSFPIFNDTKVWDDAAKKVFTDSLTKALSYLGFNADVFMWQFDGNKYTKDNDDKSQDNITQNVWQTEPTKWMNDEQYDNFVDGFQDKFTNWDEAVKFCRTKYKVSREMADNIKALYAWDIEEHKKQESNLPF